MTTSSPRPVAQSESATLSRPSISVIIGAHNAQNTIESAVSSVVKQSRPPLEVIVCDDGSTDNTYDVLTHLAQEHDCIRILRNAQNLGLAATLNRGLEHAHGSYIARMDADDISLPDRFEKEAEHLDIHLDVSVVGSAAYFFDDHGVWGELTPQRTPSIDDLLYGAPFIHPTVMIRRTALNVLGGYSDRPSDWRVEDYRLWVNMYNMGYRGENLPDKLLHYRNDRTSATRRTLRARWNEARVIHDAARSGDHTYAAKVRAGRPLVLGIMPKQIYNKLYRRRHAGISTQDYSQTTTIRTSNHRAENGT